MRVELNVLGNKRFIVEEEWLFFENKKGKILSKSLLKNCVLYYYRTNHGLTKGCTAGLMMPGINELIQIQVKKESRKEFELFINTILPFIEYKNSGVFQSITNTAIDSIKNEFHGNKSKENNKKNFCVGLIFIIIIIFVGHAILNTSNSDFSKEIRDENTKSLKNEQLKNGEFINAAENLYNGVTIYAEEDEHMEPYFTVLDIQKNVSNPGADMIENAVKVKEIPSGDIYWKDIDRMKQDFISNEKGIIKYYVKSNDSYLANN